MKKKKTPLWITLVTLTTLLNACKDKDITPKAADTVAGTYTMSFYKEGNNETGLPLGTTSGSIELTKVDDGHAKVRAVIKDSKDGTSATIFDGDEITLTTSGNRVDFSVSGNQVGHYEDNTVELLGVSKDRSYPIVIRGKR